MNNPDSRDQIIRLQQNMLTRGLEFHQDCKHHHVVSLLEGMQQNLNATTPVLIDVEEAIQPQLRMPAAPQAKPLQPPTQTNVISASILQHNKTTTATKQQAVSSTLNAIDQDTTKDIDDQSMISR